MSQPKSTGRLICSIHLSTGHEVQILSETFRTDMKALARAIFTEIGIRNIRDKDPWKIGKELNEEIRNLVRGLDEESKDRLLFLYIWEEVEKRMHEYMDFYDKMTVIEMMKNA